MKRILAFLLACSMVLCLMGCQTSPETSVPTQGQLETPSTSTSGTPDTQPTNPDPEPTTPVHVHTWKDATCVRPKTCAECGETEGAPQGHNWLDATTTAPKTCSVCGAQDGDVIFDIPEDVPVFIPENECFEENTTVIVDAITGGESLERIDAVMEDYAEKYVAYSFTATKDEEIVQPTGKLTVTFAIPEGYSDHVTVFYVAEDGTLEKLEGTIDPVARTITVELCHFSDYIVVDEGSAEHEHVPEKVSASAPTCEDSGYTTYRCECGYTYLADRVEPTGHSYGGGVITEPSCIQDGKTTYTCHCGHSYDEPIPATGHTWTDATCTSPKTCSVCQATEGAVTEHPWDEGVVTKEATEEAEGEKLYTCTACKTTRTEVIPKLDHVHLYDKVEVTAPTCTEKGFTTHTCHCGDTYTDAETAATGHTYDKGVVTAPTCIDKGFTTYACYCGHTRTDNETPATGHKWGEATCTAPKTCTICSATEGKSLGHNWQAATCTEPEICSRCAAQQGKPRGHSCEEGTCAYCGVILVVYSKGLAFTLSNDKTYYIVSGIGTCKDTVIKVPQEYNNLPVKEIGRRAFSFAAFTNVILPDSITKIGSYSFYNCTGLTDIVLPNSVTSIGSGAFSSCSALTNVTLPSSITIIEEEAFCKCSSLNSISIPDGVITIGRNAFGSCSSLTNVMIPDTVTTISASAFADCTHLTEIILPKNLCTLDCYSFFRCTNLKSYYISSNNANFCTLDGILFSKDMTTLLSHPAGKQDMAFVVPQSVHTIGDSAFSYCVNLQSITFLGTVKTIGYGAFMCCSKLSGITLPNTLITLDAGVFAGCTSLSTITIPDSVKDVVLYDTFSGCTNLKTVVLSNGIIAIGRDAFRECTSLQEITIPASVTGMGYCFEGCDNLKEIRFLGSWTPDMFCVFGEEPRSVGLCVAYYPAGNSTWTSDGDFPNLLLLPDNYGNGYYSQGLDYTLSKDGTYYIVTGIGSCTDPSIVIPSIYKDLPVCEIASNAFADSTIDVLVLSDSLQRIGSDIAKEITHLFLPNQVVSLGNLCHISRSIYIDPDNVCYVSVDGIIYTKDMQMLVYYGRNDAAFTVPDSVVHIADYAFADKKLCTINLPSGLQTIGNYAFHACGQLISLMIPNGVTNIGEHAFSACEKLNSIELPQKITVIENYTFAFCHQLTTVIIPSSVTSIGEYAFHDNLALISIIVPENVTQIGTHAFAGCWSLVNVTLPKGITTIGNYSFSGCGFTSITLPDSITAIGDGAFSGCGGLTSITIPNGVAVIGDSLFSGCRSLTSVTLPDSVTSIGKRAFYECEKLTSITIPQKLTSIAEGTFYGCSSLISITIPNGVTSIGDRVFMNCSNLQSVTIGTGVITIGESVFYACSSLSGITIPNNVTRIGQEAFACSGLKEITLPDSVTWLGREAFYHCTRLESANIGKGSTTADEFVGCTRLKNVTIREGATAIAAGMFWNCDSLEHIVIPKSVTRIGGGAFSGCSKLKSVTLSNQVVTIGSEVFDGCVSLVDINFDGTKAQWEAISKVFMWGESSHKCTVHCTDGDIEG